MKISTKKMSYEKVLERKRPEHRSPKRPSSLLRGIIRLIGSFDLRAVRFKYTRTRMKEMGKGPWLVVMNHSSFIDLEIAHKVIPGKFCIVCTSDGLVGKERLMRSIGCIPTQKFVTDPMLISDMRYALNKLSTSVLLYPEASYSFDGCATPLPRRMGILLKRLNVPVVSIITKGAFARDPLYNGLQKRKVKVTAEVRGLLTAEEIGLTAAEADEILKFIAITGSNAEVLSALEGYRGRHELFDLGLDELNTVTKYLAAFGVPETHFAVDLTIARGLDYYTGTVYETTMLDHPEIGSICSGGRYDNLAEYYTDKQLPGVGISIGLTRLFFVLEDQGYLNDQMNTAPADVLLIPMTDDLAPAIAMATQLREAGIRTQLYTEQKKFKQKMAYADKLKVPFAAFLGEDEIAQNSVSLKNMSTGEQKLLSIEDAKAEIGAMISAGAVLAPIKDR